MGMHTIKNQTTPATPPSGFTRLFVDTSDKHAKTIDDTGTIIDLAPTSQNSFNGGNGDEVINIPDGFYLSKTVTAVDSNLVASNIKNAITIFGVTGIAPIPSGNAVVGDVRSGKTFSNTSSVGLTGTIPIGSNITGTTLTPSLPNGLYESKTITISDSNLIGNNIANRKTIFGITGTFAPYSDVSNNFTHLGAPDYGYKDENTGLIWQQLDAGTNLTWNNALIYAQYLEVDGVTVAGSPQNIWHLPSIKELASAMDYIKSTSPSTYLPGIASLSYWSSAEYAPDTLYAWVVYTYDGGVYNDYKNVSSLVRCVR